VFRFVSFHFEYFQHKPVIEAQQLFGNGPWLLLVYWFSGSKRTTVKGHVWQCSICYLIQWHPFVFNTWLLHC